MSGSQTVDGFFPGRRTRKATLERWLHAHNVEFHMDDSLTFPDPPAQLCWVTRAGAHLIFAGATDANTLVKMSFSPFAPSNHFRATSGM